MSVVVVGAVLTSGWFRGQPIEISYSDFSQKLSAGRISEVRIEDSGFAVRLKDDSHAFVRMPAGLISTEFLDAAAASGAKIDFARATLNVLDVTSALLPIALVVLVLVVVAVQSGFRP